MCNRYANRGSVSEIRRLAALIDYDLATTPDTDNYGSQDNVYPDKDAPILRLMGDGKLEMAMAAGVTDRLWEVEDIVKLVDEIHHQPQKRGPYKKRG